MSERRLRRLLSFAAAAILACSNPASAEGDLLGRWRDNAPGGDPIGLLVIAKDSIALGRKVTYQVKPAGRFGDGELFEVVGSNRKQDPEGCAPTGKVHYLAVQALPPIAPGIGGPAIRVFFYAGDAPPRADTIANDPALCSVRPFSR